MAEDPEKKFQSIMDKLFHAPRSPQTRDSSSSPGSQLSRGIKRPHQSNKLALVDPKSRTRGNEEIQLSQPSSMRPSLCRPWDRGDLMRRLSTFKSMTWFAKPKVVDAVNCARKGWVNVDMDIIACEACGARILFSTPSSWSRQQVEKVALVFSLKLDNGHKLLCPWIDNTCDESLVQFPPTPIPVLVDQFKKRFSLLVQLLALPFISSSAVKLMMTPKLEQFLECSLALEMGKLSLQMPLPPKKAKPSDNLYNEALKLISLCGWKPRALPYMVVGKNADARSFSQSAPDKEQEIVMIDSSTDGEISKIDGNLRSLSDFLSDPRSVVLDCEMCGASVGLWGFSTISRTMETFRLIGFTELDNGKNSASGALCNENSSDDGNGVLGSSLSVPTSKDIVSNINMSIAGGPLPTGQNFKATISLPVIGRSIRARFSSDSDFGSHSGIDPGSHVKTTGTSIERVETTKDVPGSTTGNQPSNPGNSEQDPSVFDDTNCNLLEGTIDSRPGIFLEESSNRSTESNALGVRLNDLVNKCADEVVLVSFSGKSQNDDVHKDKPIVLDSDQNSKKINGEIVRVGNEEISPAVEDVSLAGNSDIGKGESCLESQDPSAQHKDALDEEILDNRKQLSARNYLLSSDCARSNSEEISGEGVMHFDPIRQHRPFCPWIVSSGSGNPGWQQTLSALLHQKEGSESLLVRSPSASLVKVDDPITSIRRLFTSKRSKSTHGSG